MNKEFTTPRVPPTAWTVFLATIAFAVGLILFQSIVSIPLHVPKDYNEGYYAFAAVRAFGLESLYPDSTSLIAYGYTPLFSYAAGLLGLALGDHLVAGRWIAFVSFLVVGIGIGAIVRALSSSWPAALLLALSFLGYIGLKHPRYVGMNDPQWLAQVFVIVALYVYVKSEDTRWVSIPVIALLLAAGLTKQTSVALPLALAFHLVRHRRDAMPAWLTGTVFAILASVALLYLAHGPDFLRGVLFNEAQREFSGQKVWKNAVDFVAFFMPLLAGFAVFQWLTPPTRIKHLLTAYVVSSAVIGFGLTGGQFVGWNHLYDLLIALTITTGLATAALSERLAGRIPVLMTTIAVGALINFMLLAAVPQGLAQASTVIPAVKDRQDLVARTVARVADVDGPVFCETMAICYWAGKNLTIDILELRRRLMTGTMSKDEFSRLLTSGHFSLLQFHSDGISGRTKRLPDWANDLILEHYEVEPNEMGGSFLTPRRIGPN